ncbi:MAG: type II toxin-antitoxin system HicA family toxin [Bdellovibrionales bacterium]
MNSLSSREIIKLLKKDGWEQIGTTGDHHHFKHPTKKGKVTVPHPRKDMRPGTLKSIEAQAQLNLRRR